MTPETHFAQFYLKVTFYFLSWGKKKKKKKCATPGDEAGMKIKKKIKLGLLEISTFSAITSKV